MVTQAVLKTHALSPALRRGLRFVSFVCLLLVSIVVACSIYYRRQVNDRLERAVGEVSMIPAQAYMILRPINDYNDLLTLGLRSKAQVRFLQHLHQAALRVLDSEPFPRMNAFQQARQSINIIEDLAQRLGRDAEPMTRELVDHALASLPRIREQGTISAWVAAAEFFDYLNESGMTNRPVFGGDYEAWRKATFDVPQEPLALRDAVENAMQQFQAALAQIGMTAQPVDGPELLLLPMQLSDEQLIGIDRMLDTMLKMLDEYRPRFAREQLPRELVTLEGKLQFNQGVLKLSHLIERGRTAMRMGSEFIAEQTLRRPRSSVPPVSELTEDFVTLALRELSSAAAIFSQMEQEDRGATGAPMDPVAIGNGRLMQALAYHDMALLRQLQGRPHEAWIKTADRLAADLTGDDLRSWKEQRSLGRPLMVLRFP